MNTRLGMTLTGSAAVLALLALTPASALFLPYEGNGPAGYAMAEVVHRDAGGELVSSHTVHNRLVNAGEALLIKGTFGTPLATNEMPTALCISDKVDDGISLSESTTTELGATTTFAGPGTEGRNTCVRAHIDTTIPSVAIMNATFVGGVNMVADETINSVIVCTANILASMRSCATFGDMFAGVATPAITLNTNDTANIEYTFNLTTDRF